MKKHLLIAVACLLTFSGFKSDGQAGGAEDSKIMLADVYEAEQGLRYLWLADIVTVEGLPKWKIGDDPPLSVAEAVKIAKNSLKDRGDFESHYQLFSVYLRQPIKEDSRVEVSCPIFYFITFRPPHPGERAERKYVGVLLNGQVITPIIEAMKKK